MSIELARIVKNQVDNGVLWTVSIMIGNVRIEVINGVEKIVSWKLQAVLIVDIPANENAIKQLKHNSKTLKFTCYTENRVKSRCKKQKKIDILSRIRAFLGLDEDCADGDTLTALKTLKARVPEETPDIVQDALKFNLITKNQLDKYKLMDKEGKVLLLTS